jgi:Arc/MetJ-type ribon-helix-helix transcriptional regulator
MSMSNTINVHAQFSGDVAETIEEIIRSGRAASRTEAIRLAVVMYRDHHMGAGKKQE